MMTIARKIQDNLDTIWKSSVLKFSLLLGPMLTKTINKLSMFQISKFQNPKLFYLRTIERIIQEKFNKEQIASSRTDPKMTGRYKAKVPYIC